MKIGAESLYTPGCSINEDQPHSACGGVLLGNGFTTEGQDLLLALERFAAYFSPSPKGLQMKRESSGNPDHLQGMFLDIIYSKGD